jgi:hypothetical protein
MDTQKTEQTLIMTEQLADAITKLSEAGKALATSRLKQETIVLLLHNMTKVGKKDIVFILNALPEMQRTFLKPETKSVK